MKKGIGNDFTEQVTFEYILKEWEIYPSRDVGKVNSKQKEKQEQRSRSITIYIKGNIKWMMRLEYQEQEECEKVIRGDEPGDKGWG